MSGAGERLAPAALRARLLGEGREVALPLVAALGPESLELEAWVRVLPGRRYVARALRGGQPVLLKLFCGRHWRREWRREWQGARSMRDAGVACAELLAHGAADGLGWVLLEFIAGAQTLEQAWPAADDGRRELWQRAALRACARLHAAGLLHVDLHWGNLLVAGEQLWLVDAGSVRRARWGRFGARHFSRNLGDLLAQGPMDAYPDLAGLLALYRAEPGAPALPLPELADAVDDWHDWRLRDYVAKLGRDCSLFAQRSSWRRLERCARPWCEALAPLLAAPDAAVESGRPLKLGGSSTVVEVEAAGRPLVLKRYNMKSLGHLLRRCWRGSRAAHSWREGHRLRFLGIPTPEPLAMLEHRWGPLRGRAYLVTEYRSGQDILARLDAARPAPEADLASILKIFHGLLRHRIGHGDLKGNNLLWCDGGYMLIDLDAARQYRSAGRFRRAYAADRARFLRNWPEESPLYRQLDRLLPTLD